MAILVEAYTIVLKMETIVTKYPGGWTGYAIDTNKTLRSDGEIAGFQLMAHDDVMDFVRDLISYNISFLKNSKFVEIALVCQNRGLLAECEWLEFGSLPHSSTVRLPACRLQDSKCYKLAFYENWDYEQSTIKNGRLFDENDIADHKLKFFHHNDRLDVYYDVNAKKEVHVGLTADKKIKTKIDVH